MLAYEMTIENSAKQNSFEFYVSKSGDYVEGPLPAPVSVHGRAMKWFHECVPKQAAIEDMVFSIKRELELAVEEANAKLRDIVLLQDDALDAIKYYEEESKFSN